MDEFQETLGKWNKLDAVIYVWYITARMDPWCSGRTCGPVKAEIAGSNPVGSAQNLKGSKTFEIFCWVNVPALGLDADRFQDDPYTTGLIPRLDEYAAPEYLFARLTFEGCIYHPQAYV